MKNSFEGDRTGLQLTALKQVYVLLLTGLALILLACGGGSGSSDSTPDAEVPKAPALLGVKGTTGLGYVTRYDLPAGPALKVTGRGLAGFNNVTGLAFDPNLRILYAIDQDSEVLFTLDPATGSPTEVGPVGINSIYGIAFDTSTDTLYGISGTGLYSIDIATGKASLVDTISIVFPTFSLAYHAPSGNLFAASFTTGDLYSIDPSTAQATLVGNIGATRVIRGLAYNSLTRMLNGSDESTQEIVEIDPANAALTVLGPAGFPQPVGNLAFDHARSSKTLYAVSSGQQLLTIDAGGSATAVGSFGHARVGLITWDTTSNVLYGVDQITDHLVSVDRLSGETTDIGPTGYMVMHGMAHDSNSDILYGVYSFIFDDLLLVFDRSTGAATSLGPITGIAGLVLGDLVFDPNSDTLYATNFASSPGELITINPVTLVASTVNTLGFDDVHGLAFNPGNNKMYGLNTITHELLAIDPAPGANPSATVIGPIGFIVNWGLSFDPQTNHLIAADQANGADLLIVDPSTGAGRPIESFGYDSITALAFDRNSETVYGAGSAASISFALLKIDSASKQVTVIGSTGGPILNGLAYDPNLNILYGTDHETLFTVDTASGAASAVGAIGATGFSGLAYDPNSDILYGYGGNSSLYTISTMDGVGTLIGYLGISPVGGLAFDHDSNTLFASKTYPYELYTIDPAIPAATLLGSSDYKLDGLTYTLLP